MRNKSILLVFSTLVLLASACSGASESERLSLPEEMDDVAPNEARVVATLTGVYSQRAASGPCARAACQGVIRIDSVLQYGSSFPGPLSKGQHVDVRFAFTLEPTQEAGVNVDRPFPGLSLGEAFWTDLQGLPAPGTTKFAVHEYYPARE